MNIFVTGGAGFIGKYLVDSLLKNGNRVTIFDNFSNSDKKSLGDLINKGVRVIEGDITELESISNAMNNQEIIIHLAAKISVEDSIRNPLETFRVNVEGTKNVLLACEKNHIKKHCYLRFQNPCKPRGLKMFAIYQSSIQIEPVPLF